MAVRFFFPGQGMRRNLCENLAAADFNGQSPIY